MYDTKPSLSREEHETTNQTFSQDDPFIRDTRSMPYSIEIITNKHGEYASTRAQLSVYE